MTAPIRRTSKPIQKGKKLGKVKPLMSLKNAKINPIASPKVTLNF